MSRTLKDAPHTVRARRHGHQVTDHTPNCGVRSVRGERVTAVFYAHEQRELAEFRDHAAELGYEVTEQERHGYLGERSGRELALARFSPLVRGHDEVALSFVARKVMLRPAGARQRMAVQADGTISTQRTAAAKLNIFIVVHAEKLHYGEPVCFHGQHDLEPYDRLTNRNRTRAFRRRTRR